MLSPKSTLITAQLSVAQWHDMIGEPASADAILDRIIHNPRRTALLWGQHSKA